MSSPNPIILNAGRDPIAELKAGELINNLTSLRVDLFRKLFDPRRNIYDECGYPHGYIQPELFKELYERDAVGARVVEIMPKECWQCQPTVYEDADTETKTPFEEAWYDFGKSLLGEQSWFADEEASPVWEYLLRVDILSGIGQYGILFIALDDGKDLDQPAEVIKEENSVERLSPGFEAKKQQAKKEGKEFDSKLDSRTKKPTANVDGTPINYSLTYNKEAEPRKVMYIRAFPETQARVATVEANRTSPRYGLPVLYSITFNDQSNAPTGAIGAGLVSDGGSVTGYTTHTVNVHWTRIIHIVDNWHQATSSEVASAPRQKSVLNHILALQKVYGASGEGYYKSGIPTAIIETHPSLGGDVEVDKAATRAEIENMQNSMQKFLVLIGMTAKTLPPQLIDPTNFANTHIEAICIKGGYPVRIFKGSERGELASSQDDGTHNDRLRSRRTYHVTPRIIVPLINRLIALKVLPVPEKFSVWWPDLETQTPKDKAAVAQAMTQAITTYIEGQGEQLIAPIDFFTQLLGFREQEVKAWLERAKVEWEKKQKELEAKAAEHDMIPTIPGYEQKQPDEPIKLKEGEKLVDPKKKPGVKKPAKSSPNGGGKPVSNETSSTQSEGGGGKPVKNTDNSTLDDQQDDQVE